MSKAESQMSFGGPTNQKKKANKISGGDTTFEENLGQNSALERDVASNGSKPDAKRIYHDFVNKPRQLDYQRIDSNQSQEGAIFKARDGFFPNQKGLQLVRQQDSLVK